MGQRACRIEIIQIFFFFWCLDLENSKCRQCNLANFMAGNEDTINPMTSATARIDRLEWG